MRDTVDIAVSITTLVALGLMTGALMAINDRLDKIEGTQKYHADIMQSISTSEDIIVDTQAKILEAMEDMRTVSVDVTAYTPTGEKTAVGEKATPGWTAAVSRDMSHLLGRKVYIPQIGVRQVTDLTAEDKTRTIDVLVGRTAEAVKFGRQQKEVVLL